MKKARCVPTIVSAALSLAFPLHSVFSYLQKILNGMVTFCTTLKSSLMSSGSVAELAENKKADI